MNFEIYSIGDAELMYMALNGIAMIFNTGDWTMLVRIAMILGLLFVGFKAFASMGEGRGIGQMFAAFLIGWAFFGPGSKTTVSIEDVYTGSVRQVANIPVGLALPMSLVTKLGHRMAEVMETAFGLPDGGKMTKSGFGDPLRVMLALRDADPGIANSNSAAKGDLRRSVAQYVADCVMVDVNNVQPLVTRESLAKANDLWAEMGKSNWTNIDIMVYLPSVTPYPKQMSCWEAHTAISNHLASEFGTDWSSYMLSAFGRTTGGSQSAQDVVQSSLSALNQSSVNAETFMRNALVANLWRHGEGMYYAQSGSTTATIMYTQAIQQRNVQWAAEKTLFESYARPIMALIETFTIGIAPFVILTLFLGAWGFSIMGNYMKLFAWITLWPPLLAIVNLYTMVQVRRALESVSTTGVDVAAFGGMDTLWDAAAKGLAVGGMAAALVPALALFLVWGGTNAMVGLAGRMQSSDTLNEKQAAPDIVAPAPLATNEARNQFNPNLATNGIGGMRAGGLADPNVSINAGRSVAISSASSAVTQAQQQTTQAASASWQTAMQESNSATISEMVGKGTTGSFSRTESAVMQQATKFAEGQGWNSQQKDAFTAAATMAFGRGTQGSVGINFFGMGGGATAKAELKSLMDNSGSFDASTSKSASLGFAQQASRDSGFQAQLQEASRTDKSTATQGMFSSGNTRTSLEQLGTSQQKLDSASEQYQRVQSSNVGSGQSASLPYTQLAPMLSSREGLPAMERVWDARETARANGESGEWNAQRGEIMRGFANTAARDLPLDQRERLADFLVSQQRGDPQAHEAVAALVPALQSRGLVPDGGQGNAGLASSNTIGGLSPDASSGAVAGEAGAAARAGAGGTQQRVDSGMSNAKTAIARGQGNPNSTFAGGRARVEGNYASNSAAVTSYGTERGSNLGAEEFSKVEGKRDQADAQRQEMRDKADKQGGTAIDNMLGIDPSKPATGNIGDNPAP
ncbi:MAG: conjugal transfer protein TraG [Betaproteobacteria bacterium]|nr:MAG: conjugal transfer protein TraG [Betaproteobacteria bacterium]